MATRMQQRRGTAAQWISTNSGNGPILAPGEIGFESDNNRFKIGDGVNHWVDLPYFSDNAALTDLIDGAPDLLNTLGELATALGDDPSFITTVATNLSNHASDTTNVHGIEDTSELATKTYVTTEIGNSEVDQSTLAGDGLVWDAQAQKFAVDTTLIQERVTGVSDTEIGYLSGVTSDIQTQIDSKLASADLDEAAQEAVNTALVAGTGLDKSYDDNANTITLNIDSTVATKTYADDAADAAQTAAELTASGALSTHSSDTTSIHGIADTAELATKAFAAELLTNATKTNVTITGDKNGLTITAENGVADSTTTDLTEGTNLYFTDERAQDAVGNALGNGLKYTDSSGAIEPDLALSGGLYIDNSDKLAVDGYYVTFNGAEQTLTNKTLTSPKINEDVALTATATELNYVDGVTSSIQDQLDDKMPLSGGTFSGTVYGTSLELSGDLTVDGTFSSVPTETLTVTNPMIYMGDGNPANINDLGLVASHTINGTYSHTGLVKDATDGKWKLFTGVTDEPTTTVNFSQATLDTMVAATFEGNVTGNLTGDVTGNADTATALETARTIAGQSFDGTANINISTTDLTDVTATAIEINILDGATLSTTELNYVEGVTSAIQDQIDDKAPLASPAFTGTVDFTGATVNGISSYSAPTLGSTQIASGATVTTIEDLGLNNITLGASTSTPIFVAVENNFASTKAATSTDGTAWTATTLSTGGYWNSVAYGNGVFVATASYNTASSSTDGITWVTRTLPSFEMAGWKSVTYGNGKFVAVAAGYGNTAYSTNGITWTSGALPSSGMWSSVTFGNNRFVAVENNFASVKAASSTDGISWTAGTLPTTGYWYSVAYGNNTFVATSGYNNAASSTDGITWTLRTMPSFAPDGWTTTTFGNNKFVSVARFGNAATSTDGISWSESTMPVSRQWQSATYGNNKFVAVAYNSTTAASSTDGITWTLRTMPSSAKWNAVTSGQVISSSSGTVSILGSTGTNGQVLKSTGGGVEWGTIDISTKQDIVSGVSSTEIGYLDGVTSNIQTQINAATPTFHPVFAMV